MIKLEMLLFVMVGLMSVSFGINEIKPCPGDTRGDRRCNFDATHRVCARIGLAGTSFWEFTGQNNWCNTSGSYGGEYGSQLRCPASDPSWCICKWATARWIAREGCSDDVEFDCAATDVCDLKSSYTDYKVDLEPAHDCMMKKCSNEWNACPDASSATSGASP